MDPEKSKSKNYNLISLFPITILNNINVKEIRTINIVFCKDIFQVYQYNTFQKKKNGLFNIFSKQLIRPNYLINSISGLILKILKYIRLFFEK